MDNSLNARSRKPQNMTSNTRSAPPVIQTFPILIDCVPYWSEMDALGHMNNVRYFT